MEDAMRYAEAGAVIQRREIREAMNIASSPWMDKADRNRLWRELQEPGESTTPRRKVLTKEQREAGIAEARKRLGISDGV